MAQRTARWIPCAPRAVSSPPQGRCKTSESRCRPDSVHQDHEESMGNLAPARRMRLETITNRMATVTARGILNGRGRLLYLSLTLRKNAHSIGVMVSEHTSESR